MRSRAHRSGGSVRSNAFCLEGLEGRQLLSGSSTGSGLVQAVLSGAGRSGSAGSAYVARIALGPSAAVLANDGENSSAVEAGDSNGALAPAQPSSGSGAVGDSSAVAASGLVGVSGSEDGGSAESAPASLSMGALTGSAPLGLTVVGAAPQAAPVESGAAAGLTSALTDSAVEDEPKAVLTDAAARDEQTQLTVGNGGAAYPADGSDAGPAVSAAANGPSGSGYASAVGAAPALGFGTAAASVSIHQPMAQKGETAFNVLGVSGGNEPQAVDTAAPAEAGVSVIRVKSAERPMHAARSRSDAAANGPTDPLEDNLNLHPAGLVSDFLPCDRATLERAIDQFLSQFESVAAELSQIEPSSALLSAATGVAVATLAFDAIHRRRRSRAKALGESTSGLGDDLTFLESLPSSWTWRIAEA
jgi:hypothetical protein